MGDGDAVQVEDAINQKSYRMSGRIMMSSIVVLFVMVCLMVLLHLYAKWYLSRQRRRLAGGVDVENHHIHDVVLYMENPNNPSFATGPCIRVGLDPDVIATLPLFLYQSKTHPEAMDCAVCLSDFEENDVGRVLPECGHSFHVECIDMWFRSHVTCPLCRSKVEPVKPAKKIPPETAENGNVPGSSSGFPDPGSGSGESRLMSWKRVLSISWKSSPERDMASSRSAGTSFGQMEEAEWDLERGSVESTRAENLR